MKKNTNLVFGISFCLFCIILYAVIWFSLHVLYEDRMEYDQLDAERNNHNGIITSLEARNQNLKRVAALSVNNAEAVSDAVSFYAMVRQTIDRYSNNIMMLSMSTSGRNGQEGKDNLLSLKLSGNYYAIMNMIADWRNLPAASKITSLHLKRNHDLPEKIVEVDVVLEVMVEE